MQVQNYSPVNLLFNYVLCSMGLLGMFEKSSAYICVYAVFIFYSALAQTPRESV